MCAACLFFCSSPACQAPAGASRFKDEGARPPLQALERYERALQLEPSNGQFQEALSRARVAAGKQEAEGKHRFKRKASAAAEERPVALAGSGKAPVKKRSTILSFSADEDDDGET